MRELKYIVLHCSATPVTMDVGAAEIRKWHKGKGWKDIGYHFVIKLSGKLEYGRPLQQIGSHVLGYNRASVGICYVGGMEDKKAKDTMNPKQEKTFRDLVATLRNRFGPLEVWGHNDFTDAKACPSFKVGEKFADLKLDVNAPLPDE